MCFRAEYVEDEAITRGLEDIGIDYAQGYHFGKPEALMPTAADQTVTRLLQA